MNDFKPGNLPTTTSTSAACQADTPRVDTAPTSAARPKKAGRPKNKDAKPVKQVRGYAMRGSVNGVRVYVSGKASASAARQAFEARANILKSQGKPKGVGPSRTTVAQALQDYGLQQVRFLKGASQEVRRINKYLRAARLQALCVLTPEPTGVHRLADDPHDVATARQRRQGAVFIIDLEPVVEEERHIPQGLHQHRRKLATATAKSDALRVRLANTYMADVTRDQVQEFMDALKVEGLAPATIALERALLRRIFNYAMSRWNWNEPQNNPATLLDIEPVDNGRERVMSFEEQARLDLAIAECRNRATGPALTLLRETAMRTSEPIAYAKWCDINWERKVIHLRDSKEGKRNVPLSPAAIEVLAPTEI